MPSAAETEKPRKHHETEVEPREPGLQGRALRDLGLAPPVEGVEARDGGREPAEQEGRGEERGDADEGEQARRGPSGDGGEEGEGGEEGQGEEERRVGFVSGLVVRG